MTCGYPHLRLLVLGPTPAPEATMPISDAKRLKLITESILQNYRLHTRSSGRYLTDAMRRAIASDAMFHVMLERYEAEEGKVADGEPPTSPNIYVDAMRSVLETLEL